MIRKLMMALAVVAIMAFSAVPVFADDKKDYGKKKGDTNTAIAANFLKQSNTAYVEGDYNNVLQINAAQQQAAAAAGPFAFASNVFSVSVGE